MTPDLSSIPQGALVEHVDNHCGRNRADFLSFKRVKPLVLPPGRGSLGCCPCRRDGGAGRWLFLFERGSRPRCLWNPGCRHRDSHTLFAPRTFQFMPRRPRPYADLLAAMRAVEFDHGPPFPAYPIKTRHDSRANIAGVMVRSIRLPQMRRTLLYLFKPITMQGLLEVCPALGTVVLLRNKQDQQA